jgi:hypothetical protein
MESGLKLLQCVVEIRISVAHRVSSLAGVCGSTAHRAENIGASQW